jgi:iron complex outermembrane receptor protein
LVLPEFVLHENPANPYQSSQALSTSRVAVPIQDIPQTISVVTSELIADTQGNRMLDVAKYVTPVVESTLPFGGDRYQIRGFQVSQEFIDGTNISGADGYSMSIAPFNIERVEVIKGPNAILVPGGSPGGVMNPITKSPISKNQASVTLDLAQYYGRDVNFDINRVIDAKNDMAVRVVAAYWNSDGYVKNNFRKGFMFAPSFSVRLSPTQKLTLKAEFVDNREANLGGLPIDPTVGSDGYARIAPGLPRDWSFGDDVDSRHRATQRVSGELLSTLGDHVTSRLYIMGDHVTRRDVGGTNAAISNLPSGGGSRNPFTGKFEPGVLWTVDNSGANAVVTSSLLTLPKPSDYIYSRNVGKVFLDYTEAHLKNDYAARFETPWFKSTTITGISANTSKVHFISFQSAGRAPVAANALDAITYGWYYFAPPTPTVGSVVGSGTDRTAKQNDLQVFLYETLSFWNDRIQASGGVSRFWGELTRTDTTNTDLGVNVPSYNLSDTAKSFGLVLKPLKEISLFYGYNSSGGTMPGSITAGKNPASLKVATGNQNEFGLKTSWFNGALTTSVSYFEIEQQNYPVPNSEYYTLIALGRNAEAQALQNPLYLNLTSKGWEGEATYSWNKNLTILGNVSIYKTRQPIGNVRLRAVPDKIAAIYGDYRFTEGPLKNFGFNLGIDYKSDVVGENVTAYTTTSPLPGSTPFVAQQPTFKVAGRTLVNLGVNYNAKQWTARLTVYNLMDKDYILAAGSRTALVVGDPRSVKGSVTYKF